MEPQISQITQTQSHDGDPETFAIIGAAMEVHRELGSGFLEAVNQEALKLEFNNRPILFRSQVPLPIRYKGSVLDCSFRADFICFDAIVVELKAADQLGRHDAAQLINYLKATGFKKGLLLNFKPASLEFRRIVY